MEFGKSFTQVRFTKFLILPEILYKTFLGKNSDVFLIYFEQIVSYCAIIYSNTNSLNFFLKTQAWIWQISQLLQLHNYN